MSEPSDEALDITKIAGELAKKVPYFSLAKAAYFHIRNHRLAAFLRDVAGSIDQSETERERLNSILNSKEGFELLADFTEQAVRTRSRTAIGALALLYAEPADLRFETDFKAEAAQALDGVADRALFAFLHLCRLRPTIDSGDTRQPIATVNDETIAGDPQLFRLGWSMHQWVVVIDDLERRGFLRADLSGAGRVGSEETAWERRFRFSEEGERYERLLTRARALIGEVPITET